MRFHAFQHDVIHNEWEANRLMIETQFAESEVRQGDFVVLPEMTDTGWSMDIDKIADNGSVNWAMGLASKFGIWIQIGWATKKGAKGQNCVSICSPGGESVGSYIKNFTCNPISENQFYECGDELIVIDTGHCRICPLICYDLRFPELWRPAAIKGVDVFTLSSSWPIARIQHWEGLLIGRAIENQAAIVAANRCGKDKTAHWGGKSMIVLPNGETVAIASEIDANVLLSDIDIDEIRNLRQSFPVFNDIKEELIGNINVQTIYA